MKMHDLIFYQYVKTYTPTQWGVSYSVETSQISSISPAWKCFSPHLYANTFHSTSKEQRFFLISISLWNIQKIFLIGKKLLFIFF